MSGKGDRNRSGSLPDDCFLWRDKKPSYLKTEAELEESSGVFVLSGNGELVKAGVGEISNNDATLMTSITFGRTRGEQVSELARLKKAGINAVGYDKGGGLQFRGGLTTQKKLCKFYSDGVLDVG